MGQKFYHFVTIKNPYLNYYQIDPNVVTNYVNKHKNNDVFEEGYLTDKINTEGIVIQVKLFCYETNVFIVTLEQVVQTVLKNETSTGGKKSQIRQVETTAL